MDSFDQALELEASYFTHGLSQDSGQVQVSRPAICPANEEGQEEEATHCTQALIVGESPVVRLVTAALNAEHIKVDTCDFISTAFLVSFDTCLDLILVIAEKPLGKLNHSAKRDSMYTVLRQRSALIAVAVADAAAIEPTYLEAGFDAVIPVHEFSTAVCNARINAVLRRVGSR